MGFEIINGNLLDAFDRGEVDVIGHCCNRLNNFGAGIAKSIKLRYPEAYIADTIWFNNQYKNHSWCNVKDKSNLFIWKAIYNLYGQNGFGNQDPYFKKHGRNVDYRKLEDAFIEMKNNLYTSRDSIVIGFPFKIACDRARGDWSIVSNMIDQVFKGFTVKIYKLEE